jgi:hypothetical protein
VQELQRAVSSTADHLGLHATAPTLVLGLQARLGALAAEVERATELGRRPFRGSPDWERLLGDIGFALLNLADQTGVDLDRAIRVATDLLYRSGLQQQQQRAQSGPDAWPFSG